MGVCDKRDVDIPDQQISAFARKLMGDLHRYYPQLLEQEAVVEAALGVGLDPEGPMTALTLARIKVVEEVEDSLRRWLTENEVPLAETEDSSRS